MTAAGLPARSSPHVPLRMLTVFAVLMAALLTASCGSRCDSHVDYTIPPVPDVLAGASAVVRAHMIRFTTVEDYTVEAELDIIELLAQVTEADVPAIDGGSLIVGAYDDPCGRRTGLRFAEGNEVVVVLQWLGPDSPTWSTPWQAFRVLAEGPDGLLVFLDTGQELNERIDEILPDRTLTGLVSSIFGHSSNL